MLTTYGQFYAANEELLAEVSTALNNEGYILARIVNTAGVTVLKNIPDPNQDDENA